MVAIVSLVSHNLKSKLYVEFFSIIPYDLNYFQPNESLVGDYGNPVWFLRIEVRKAYNSYIQHLIPPRGFASHV
jgi:hypothetical protein